MDNLQQSTEEVKINQAIKENAQNVNHYRKEIEKRRALGNQSLINNIKGTLAQINERLDLVDLKNVLLKIDDKLEITYHNNEFIIANSEKLDSIVLQTELNEELITKFETITNDKLNSIKDELEMSRKSLIMQNKLICFLTIFNFVFFLIYLFKSNKKKKIKKLSLRRIKRH